MDVSRRAFLWQFPRILRALADAHFISIDLELSGIQSKSASKNKGTDGDQGTKQTLQERYKEAKEAAEKYQVLQIGITLVNEDSERG